MAPVGPYVSNTMRAKRDVLEMYWQGPIVCSVGALSGRRRALQ